MPAKLISIEVCDKIAMVCRTVRKGKNVRVSDSFMFRTPESCVSDGIIANTQVLASELKRQLASHGLGSIKNVCFTISSSKIAAREVKLPPIKGKRLDAAIKTNAPDYFPVDLNTYHIAYKQLEYVSGTAPFIRVMVMAAPVSMLEGYFKLAELAGLSVKAIDISGNSQYQALKQIKNKGVTIYADIGASSSLVSFILEDNLLLQRTFAFGADELIGHYLSLSGSEKSYLDAIRETDISSPDFKADDILSYDDIQSDLNRLVSGIVRSVDFFNSSQWELTASRVVLMGSNRHIVGLRDFVSASTGLETIYLDDIPEFTAFTGGAEDASAYISCIGSALAPFNLMPQQLVTKRPNDTRDTSLRPGIIICALLIVSGIAVSALSIADYNSSLSELKNAKAEILSLADAEKEYNAFVSYQKGEEALNEVAANSDTPNAKLVSFFEELEEKMPSSILVLSAECTDDGVSMNITVSNYVDAASAISDLREFESLKDLKTSEITRSKDYSGVLRVHFTVSCSYGENPYLTGANPYSSLVSPSPSPTVSPAASPESTAKSAEEAKK
jgi:type IV pilus assembly protein PilN